MYPVKLMLTLNINPINIVILLFYSLLLFLASTAQVEP